MMNEQCSWSARSDLVDDGGPDSCNDLKADQFAGREPTELPVCAALLVSILISHAVHYEGRCVEKHRG